MSLVGSHRVLCSPAIDRYTNDDAGNKTSVEEHTGYRFEYTYDELYRLTQESITDPHEGDR
ncbi:MAG: RHS repeat protein [Leptolyngbya sp. SIOISBB]|nr:RHS repeat protein [Leptolyngbya sp. SIOISBB]